MSRRLAVWTTGLLVLLGLVLVVAHVGEVERFSELVRHVRPEWLAVALVLQAATYVCAAAIWQRSLVGLGTRRSLVNLLPLGLAKLFTDQAIPSAGLSGTLLVVRGLGRRGVSRRTATGAVVISLVGYYFASVAAVLAALVVGLLMRDSRRALAWLATPVLVLIFVVPIAGLWLRKRGAARLPRWLRRAPPFIHATRALRSARGAGGARRKALLEAGAFQLAIVLLDAATLAAALAAMGIRAGPAVVFLSYVTASMVATFTLIPGGIGTFDGTCVAMLHLSGVPIEASLGVTLLFRGFTLLLPLAPGLWLARRELG